LHDDSAAPLWHTCHLLLLLVLLLVLLLLFKLVLLPPSAPSRQTGARGHSQGSARLFTFV
jgi:hypothetical protein